MSRSLVDRLRREAGEDGFSLVEIMIAMTIFAIVVISTAPLLVGGLKAGRQAQLNLQGKALGQERLEIMRNLPFHVARQNGQYLDLLDLYFRDLQPAGAPAPADVCTSRTYDAGSRTYSCAITDLGADYAEFSQTVEATFIDFQRQTVAPPTTYDSQVQGLDSPASTLLGVVVTTSWNQGDRVSSFALRSQFSNSQADESSLQADLSLAALTVTSGAVGGDILQFQGGLLNAEGSLTTGSTASLTASAARAARSSGAEEVGAELSLSAPPAVLGTGDVNQSGRMLQSSCSLICFGKTDVTGNKDVTVDLGQPQVSTADPASQILSSLSRSGLNVFRGYSYSNALPAETAPDLLLDPGKPHVSDGSASNAEVLHSKGFLDAAGTGTTAVRAGGSTRVSALELFPTSFAPAGIIRISLDASIACTSGAGSGSVTAGWTGLVQRWVQTGVDTDNLPTGVYVDMPIAPTALAPGATLLPDPDTTPVLRPSLGTNAATDVNLSRWIDSWSALADPTAATSSAGVRTVGNIDAVISLLTTATRVGDATSAINIAVGALSCLAEDNR